MSQVEFWWWQGAVVAGFIVLIAWTLNRINRRGTYIRLNVLLWCSGYVICSAFAIGFGLMALELTAVEERLKQPSTVRPITLEWGREMPLEMRAENSLTIARSVYESSGEIFNYFDKDGRLAPFAPNDVDRANRERQLAMPRIRAKFSALASAVWLFVPLVISGLMAWGLWKRRDR